MRFPSRRWRLGLLAALPLAALLALSVGLIAAGGGRVTEANFQRLQVGMTREQVDQILGTDDLRFRTNDGLTWWVVYREEGGSVEITVEFVHDRLTDKRLERVPLTLGDFLRAWLAKVRRRLGL